MAPMALWTSFFTALRGSVSAVDLNMLRAHQRLQGLTGLHPAPERYNQQIGRTMHQLMQDQPNMFYDLVRVGDNNYHGLFEIFRRPRSSPTPAG